MSTAVNRLAAIFIFCTLTVAACTVCNLFVALPEQRALAEQQRTWRAEDADAEARAKAARARQIVQEAELLVLQKKNLDIARQINLSIR